MARKVIKIGSSTGVTVPKKQLEELGLSIGDEVNITVEPVSKKLDNHGKLMDEYQKFVKVYGKTLKNLAKH